jgi:hypothetical protein
LIVNSVIIFDDAIQPRVDEIDFKLAAVCKYNPGERSANRSKRIDKKDSQAYPGGRHAQT